MAKLKVLRKKLDEQLGLPPESPDDKSKFIAKKSIMDDQRKQ